MSAALAPVASVCFVMKYEVYFLGLSAELNRVARVFWPSLLYLTTKFGDEFI